MEINVKESKVGCLSNASNSCIKKIIFQTLIDFTQVNKCSNVTCDTICKRERFFGPFQEIQYSCCRINDLAYNSTDLSHCIKRCSRKNFAQLEIIITTTSILALISMYHYSKMVYTMERKVKLNICILVVYSLIFLR